MIVFLLYTLTHVSLYHKKLTVDESYTHTDYEQVEDSLKVSRQTKKTKERD